MNVKCRSAMVTLAVVAVICAGMLVPAAAHVAAPASSGSVVQVLKNRNCGWGIKTKYHSCDLAYSLVLRWVEEDYPSQLPSVFSPNSGRRYDVKCSGAKTITCKSNRGSVTFQPAKLPGQYKCGTYFEEWAVYAWLDSSCQFAVRVSEARSAMPTSPTLTVVDPADNRTHTVVCFRADMYELHMCISGKKAVVFSDAMKYPGAAR